MPVFLSGNELAKSACVDDFAVHLCLETVYVGFGNLVSWHKL